MRPLPALRADGHGRGRTADCRHHQGSCLRTRIYLATDFTDDTDNFESHRRKHRIFFKTTNLTDSCVPMVLSSLRWKAAKPSGKRQSRVHELRELREF